MLIPSTVNPNIIKVYKTPSFILDRYKSRLISANFDWEEGVPKTLSELCIISIAEHWEENPILNEIVEPIDKYLLLDILSVDLPLKLTVPLIEEDVYWRRCFINKWPKKIPLDVAEVESYEIVKISSSRKSSINESINSRRSSRRSSKEERRKSSLNLEQKRSWKECFFEMYVKEYLETMKPENYDAEKVKELSDLCGSYIKKLNIDELQCSENSCYRIPLNPILMAFQNLKELSICFKQKYVGENFSWNVVTTTENEIKLLAKGLEQCRLNIFRLLKSDIDCNKVEIILIALKKHDHLRIMDFSHCKISDRGALEISRFLIDSPLRYLILTNNKIGLDGVKALCYGLSCRSCKLNLLDIRLNHICNDGANFIMKTLAFKDVNLKTLIISSCGITKIPYMEEMIKVNRNLQTLDISNNNIGEEAGILILDSLNYNKSLKFVDIRMCKITSLTELNIKNKLEQTRKKKTAAQQYIMDSEMKIQFENELLKEEVYFK